MIEALTGRLLSGTSATAVLETWCTERGLSGAPLRAQRLSEPDHPPPSRDLFALAPDESIHYRRVRLSWGPHTLSEADNWYVPARLTPEMNRLLASTDHPFGRVVHPLAPTRQNHDVRRLWSGGALAAGDALLTISALLRMPDGVPFCAVHETYLGALVLADQHIVRRDGGRFGAGKCVTAEGQGIFRDPEIAKHAPERQPCGRCLSCAISPVANTGGRKDNMTLTKRAWTCLVAAGFVSIGLAGSALAQKAVDPSGVWLTETGDSKVRIARCGGGYCGTLVSVSGPGLDDKNPEPSLRTRSLVGVQIMNANRATSDGYEGTLYNPKDGKTYSGGLTIKGPSTVEVAGCVMSVFCKRQTWKRVN